MEKTPTSLETLKELIEENILATEENTKILRAMRRDAIIGGILKFVFWIILIVASFYFSAKFLEPYLGTLMGQEATGDPDIEALIKLYGEQLGQ
jgi:hypothetical protein